MPDSLYDDAFTAIYAGAGASYPSPADWRDCPIYFLMVDRFNNPTTKPRHEPYDDPDFYDYQGGTFGGIKEQLAYIARLGARAIWLSPVLKNPPFLSTYHGYGIHDFLRAEPRFASDGAKADDELRDLVDAAHAHGLYVIFDIVLNHTNDVFAYVCDAGDDVCHQNDGGEAGYHDDRQPVMWRDENGRARADWPDVGAIAQPPKDALVWPSELRKDLFFCKQGGTSPNDDTVGDFASLKQMATWNGELQSHLIRAYQYVIRRFDIDGFRIDTLRYLKGGLAQTFGNAIREYALSIGKANFFTFGEVMTGDAEGVIANFIGRNTVTDSGDLVGVDAALDYPLYNALKPVVKGFAAPRSVVDMYRNRRSVERNILSSHGDATRFFVTFLDNHDVKERLRHLDGSQQAALDDEVTLGIAGLACLPGIPCIYYGTEQGLHGAGSDAAVREAIWGSPGFAETSPFFVSIAALLKLRAENPALRYGRFYPRQISGDGRSFGFSTFNPGVLVFSRILNDREIVVCLNLSKTQDQTLHVIVDATLAGEAMATLFSSKGASGAAPVEAISQASVEEIDGSTSHGDVKAVRVALAAAEVRILG